MTETTTATTTGTTTGTRRRHWAAGVVFYVGLATVLTLIWFEALGHVLPEAVSGRVGHNSEGLLLAMVLAAWIQFVRPRLALSQYEWVVTASAAMLALVGALALLATDLPSRFRTLNETMLALAVLIPYLQLRRPLGRWPQGAALALLLVIVIGHANSVVVLLAEVLGMLILAPLAFDVLDRGILDPSARTVPAARWAWYAVLVAAPVVFSLVGAGSPEGVLGVFNGYAIRTIEAFLGLLLVGLLFAVCLGRTGVPARSPASSPRREEPGRLA